MSPESRRTNIPPIPSPAQRDAPAPELSGQTTSVPSPPQVSNDNPSAKVQSLPNQAARVAALAPLIAGLINLIAGSGHFAKSSADARFVAITVAISNAIIIVGGFLAGVYALLKFRQLNNWRYIASAVLGTTICVLLIIASVWMLLQTASIAQIRNQLVGTWTGSVMFDDAPVVVTFTFKQDDTYVQTAGTGQMKGKWKMFDQTLGLTAENHPTISSTVYSRFGTVTFNGPDEFEVQALGGPETYRRLK